MKIVIQLLLWAVIGFLGYLTFNAVYEPIQFNKVRDARYLSQHYQKIQIKGIYQKLINWQESKILKGDRS